MLGRALLLIVIILSSSVAAAAVSVRATLDPPQVQPGEEAQLNVQIEGAQSTPAPELGNVSGLVVRYLGPSSQIQIVNGRTSASITHRFSVIGTTPGRFTIGPIAVTHEGKRLDGGSVTLQVLASGKAPDHGGEGSAQLRLVLTTPKTDVYLRERLPLSVKLLVGATQVSDLQYPTVPGDGFSLERFPEPEQRREQTAEGLFHVVEFKTTLTPLRSGTLNVGPAAIELAQLVRGRSHDPFFGSVFGQTRRAQELHSAPLVLNVLPLPEAERPADFSGAVGSFEFDASAAPLEVTAGDPVTVTLAIRGQGTLEGVTPPTLPGDASLRVYPVQPRSGAPTAAGERVFEQVVIPQRAGAVALPPLRFSFFDPTARAYRTIARPPITLTVRAGAPTEATPRILGGPAPQAAERLGRDIVFIKDAPGRLRARGARLWTSPLFWGLQALPLTLWVAALLYDRRRRQLSGDVRYARFTRAGREARQAFAGARQALQAGDRAAFYDTLARAVSDYLAAKLDLPPGGVGVERVGERLRERGLAPDVARDLESFFGACEEARFAPAAGGADTERTLARAEEIVRRLERERRLGRPIAAAWLLVVLAGVAGAATAESPNTLFFRGNTLYAEERYPDAAAQYEGVLAGGHESAALYFNLGNAWFKSGDVGRALLNYERARRLAPRDPDIEANAGLARELGGEPDDPPLWARLVFPLATRASGDELALVSSLLFAATLLLLAAAHLVPAARRGARLAAATAGVLLLVAGSSAAYRILAVERPLRAVVVASGESTVRFEPSAGGTVHFQAKPGTVLRVLAEREGWAQVARADGRRGWIERGTLETL